MVLHRDEEPGLLDHAGGIEQLSEADATEIVCWLAQTGPRRHRARAANAVAAAFELGRRLAIARAETPERFKSAGDVAAWARPRIGHLNHEELWLIAVDGRGHLRATRCLAKGGLHGASVQPSDMLRAALRASGSAFILVHNHPSGDPTPSREDVIFTARVAEAARIAGLVLLDHVVVTRNAFACVAYA